MLTRGAEVGLCSDYCGFLCGSAGNTLVEQAGLTSSSTQGGDGRGMSKKTDLLFQEEDSSARRDIIHPSQIEMPSRKRPILLHIPFCVRSAITRKLPCIQIGLQKETEFLLGCDFLNAEVVRKWWLRFYRFPIK